MESQQQQTAAAVVDASLAAMFCFKIHTLLIHFSKLKHYTIYIFTFSLTASIMLIVVGVVVACSNIEQAGPS